MDRTNGDGFADLMLGVLNASTITANPTHNYFRWIDYGAYVNDDFKVTPTLTLNLGVRYEIDAPPHDKYGRMDELRAVARQNHHCQRQAFRTSTIGLQQSRLDRHGGACQRLWHAEFAGLHQLHELRSPLRFCLASQGGQRTVLRGGYGWFYSGTVLNDIRTKPGRVLPVLGQFELRAAWRAT